MRLAALPEALAELDETIAYYEAQRPGLGYEFLLAIEATVQLAADTPGVGSRVLGSDHGDDVRKYRVERFPYLLFVAGPAESRTVVAISHAARRPGYWKSRVR